MSRRVQAIVVLGITLSMIFGIAPPASQAAPQQSSSLKELRDKQNEVRNQKSSQAGKVNALRADESEVNAALTALNNQVSAQQSRVEEAERAVEAAEAELASAQEAQVAKQAELDELTKQLKDVAVTAYINAEDNLLTGAIGTGDVNEAVHKRTLLSLQSTDSISLTDRIRSAQEDLAIETDRAAEAEAEAQKQRGEVQSRMDELAKAQSEQQEFANQVEARLESALAEAASLEALDAELSQSITAKQAEIARNLAAQRRAEEERARQRAAANRTSTQSSGSSGSRSSGGTPPPIVGSGDIVSVNGIQVHRSIAANVSSLLAAAAADGIHLSGGGYRSSAGQIQTRRNNCGSSHYAIYEMPSSQCRPPTARPGSSMHEQGLAIDFTQGGRILNRSSSGFRWLQSNAGRFGLKNLPSEPWHWSTNGR